MISQNLRSLFFFEKNRLVFFQEKNLIFLKIIEGNKFAVECVSTDIISENVFSTLFVKFFLQKKLEKLMKKEYFVKKNHLFKKHP